MMSAKPMIEARPDEPSGRTRTRGGGTVLAFDRDRTRRRPSEGGSRSAIKAIVVSDEALVRAGLEAVLQEDGRVVVIGAVATPREATRPVRELRPDVLVVDSEATAEVRDALRTITASMPSPCVLLLTRDDSDDRVLSALRAGATGVLSRDVDAAELRRAVRLLTEGGIVLSPVATRRLVGKLAASPWPARRVDLPAAVLRPAH